MILRSKGRAVLAFSVAGSMALGLLVPLGAGAATTPGLAGAGEPSYVSLHQYITNTDVEDVYRVTLTVGGVERSAVRTEVVVAMDVSESMNYEANGASWHSRPNVADGGGTYSGTLYDSSGANPGSSTAPLDPKFPDGWLRPLDSAYTYPTKLKAAAEGLSAGLEIFYDPGSNPGYGRSRLGISAFAGPSNVGFGDYAENAGRAIVGWPGNAPGGPATGTPGNQRETLLHFGYGDDRMTLGSASTGPNGSGIVYSTRIADSATISSWTAGGTFNYDNNMYSTTHFPKPSAWTWTGQNRPDLTNGPRPAGGDGNLYYSWLVGDTATAGPEAARPLLQYNGRANLGINDNSQAGLVSHDGKDALQAELREYLRASTDAGQESQIAAGLEEAELIFFGDIGGSAAPVQPGIGQIADPVRRYVIFLTDGDLGDATESEVLNVAGRLKGAGVTIMTMAISTPAGMGASGPVELTDSQIDGNAHKDVSIKTYDAGSLYNIPFREAVQSYGGNYADFGTTSYLDPVATGTPGRTDSTTGDPGAFILGVDSLFSYYDYTGSFYGGGEYNYLPLMAYVSMPLLKDDGAGGWEPATAAEYNDSIALGDTWEDVENIYRPTVAGDMESSTVNGNKVDVENWHFEYIPSRDPEKIAAVFDDFVRKIVMMGQDARADIQLSSIFDVYDMPGHPRFETNVGNVTQNGKNLVWDHEKAGVPLAGLHYLSFYVKLDKDAAKDGMFYDPLTAAYYTVTGPLKTAANPNPDPITGEYPISTISIDFPPAYLSPKGEIQQEEEGEPDLSDFKGSTGAAQHQQNRQSAKDTAASSGNALDVTPEIIGLKAGVGLKGRTKVAVEMINGAQMRYQWQVKNEKGEWEDIFGATSSQYTLGAVFAAGKDYELRCRITNGAGRIVYTDSIIVTAAASSEANLQSK